MDDKTYYGWTNYATWRVNLEMFDGVIATEWFPPEDGRPATFNVAEYLRDYAHEIIEEETSVNVTGSSFARDYALAFLSDVDWFQIADAMLSDIEWTEEA
jgi:hypothetical protein